MIEIIVNGKSMAWTSEKMYTPDYRHAELSGRKRRFVVALNGELLPAEHGLQPE